MDVPWVSWLLQEHLVSVSIHLPKKTSLPRVNEVYSHPTALAESGVRYAAIDAQFWTRYGHEMAHSRVQ